MLVALVALPFSIATNGAAVKSPSIQLAHNTEQRVSGITVLLKLSSRRGECLPDVMIDALVQVAAQGVFRQHVRDKVQPDVSPLFEGFRYLPAR